MKKAIIIILVMVMILSLVACGSEPSDGTIDVGNGSVDTSVSDDSNVEKEEKKENDKNTKKDSGKFDECESLKVIASYIYDGDTYVIVENVGNQPILDFTVAYLNFDSNGFSTITDSEGYEGGRSTAANIMPGQKYQAGWYGASGQFATATVTSVTYADGSSWEATGIDGWVVDQEAKFTVQGYKERIKALKKDADLAETTPYIELTDYSLVHGNKYSDKLDLHFTLTNICDTGVTEMRLFVLEFDENGFPVSVSPYDIYCTNGHTTGGTVNLAAGASKEFVNDLFTDGTTTQLKSIIYEVTLQDGTVWVNPNAYEWILVNHNSY